MIVLIVMALAVTALFIAVETYLAGDQLAAGVLAGIGLIALAMSMGVTSTNPRLQSAEVKIEVPKVMTTIECTIKDCDTKTVREFQRGDYVYKELDIPCHKMQRQTNDNSNLQRSQRKRKNLQRLRS